MEVDVAIPLCRDQYRRRDDASMTGMDQIPPLTRRFGRTPSGRLHICTVIIYFGIVREPRAWIAPPFGQPESSAPPRPRKPGFQHFVDHAPRGVISNNYFAKRLINSSVAR